MMFVSSLLTYAATKKKQNQHWVVYSEPSLKYHNDGLMTKGAKHKYLMKSLKSTSKQFTMLVIYNSSDTFDDDILVDLDIIDENDVNVANDI